MLAKLLSLLFHAKAGLLSGVLLLGATGALVSVSAANGVTTITVTQPSASPSSAVTTVTATRSPKPSESPEPSKSPKLSSSTSSACSDAAKALSLQVQRVDTAFKGFHTDLMHLRGQRSVVVVETADVTLKNVRQAAVKAIHATQSTDCKKADEDDKDKTDNDEDSSTAASGTTALNTDREKDEDSDTDGHGKKATSPITFTGTDATGIADQAIAMMQAAFDTANTAAASTPKPKPSHSPEPSHSPRVPQSSHKPDVKGDRD
jgi:hypothetical protein